MSVLHLKLLRDLWRMKWQYAAVAFMILLGIAFYGASITSYRNLHASYEYSYDRLYFEHLAVPMEYAPARVVDRVRSIPGVVAAEGRLVEDVGVEIPGREKKMIGRLVSIPVDREPSVDRLRLIEGSFPAGSGAREILIEASFANENALEPGDTLELTSSEGTLSVAVSGVVRSPEYIYVVRSKQDLFAMPGTFGVMFVREDVLGPLVNRSGQINEVKVRVSSHANAVAVGREAERRLYSYDPDEPVLREEQPSHQLLQQDLDGFRTYAFLFPLLFLGVSALTVYTLMTRTVHLQRPVIGLLRALGFDRWRVVLHYLFASVLVGLVGSVLGVALGVWLGVLLTRFYLSQIAVPYERIEANISVYLTGVVIGVSVCLVSGAWPSFAAARVRPVETMRGAEVGVGRVVRLDRLFPGLSLLRRIPIRNLFRQWRRTLSTLFGTTAGIALIMTAQGLLDSMLVIMDRLTSSMFSDDLRLEFVQYQDPGVVDAISRWDGVVWAEGSLDVPAEFLFRENAYSAAIMGIDPGSQQRTVHDADGRPIDLSQEGIVIGPTIQDRLGAQVGDTIQVQLPAAMRREGVARTENVRVIAVCDEPIGTVAYMDRSLVWRHFKEQLDMPPNAVTSVRLQVHEDRIEELRRRLTGLPDAAGVTSVTDVRKMVDQMMNTFRTFVNYMLVFGAALAFSIVFSTVTINVLERTNEIATMRTLGVSWREVAGMVTLENLLLALAGTAIGLPVGRWFVEQFWFAAQTEEQMELFSMEVTVLPQSYFMAGALIIVVVLLSQVPALHMLSKLDLAKATKERAT
jgi:putative ABC transport system permease protein